MLIDRRLSIAPMMSYTDRHYRYLMRLLAPHTLLYTEMIHAQAVLQGPRQQLLQFHPDEHPLAIQLGGSDPKILAEAAAIAEQYGYDEVNLNIGCPSDRVQAGEFGACLMLKPDLVAECVLTMKQQTQLPVTIKTRIGVDDHDSYHELVNFISTTAKAGCQTFIIHARKAWLKGLSPKENRNVPPLNYAMVYQLKRDFPNLEIIINGGINDVATATTMLNHVDGMMIGRQAYENPWFMTELEQAIFEATKPGLEPDRLLNLYVAYMQTEMSNGTKINAMTRHLLHLFQGQAGARHWRRYLSQHAYKPTADSDIIWQAYTRMQAAGDMIMA